LHRGFAALPSSCAIQLPRGLGERAPDLGSDQLLYRDRKCVHGDMPSHRDWLKLNNDRSPLSGRRLRRFAA
jgi:hypothetical protein